MDMKKCCLQWTLDVQQCSAMPMVGQSAGREAKCAGGEAECAVGASKCSVGAAECAGGAA